MEASAGDLSGQLFEVGVTPDSVSHNAYTMNFTSGFSVAPIVIAAMQSHDGGDTAGLRYRNTTDGSVQIKVEEEQSRDTEVSHTTEVVGYMAFEPGAVLMGQ